MWADGSFAEPKPGYRYVTQVYFPPLPPDVQRITVITRTPSGR